MFDMVSNGHTDKRVDFKRFRECASFQIGHNVPLQKGSTPHGQTDNSRGPKRPKAHHPFGPRTPLTTSHVLRLQKRCLYSAASPPISVVVCCVGCLREEGTNEPNPILAVPRVTEGRALLPFD
uniref:Uncharacterized protein n=1 Tax=Panagrellus redivivus TaxID=6233 RepID=A0A7E4W5K0_PANRE